jgi:hypothetical protein
MSFTDRLVLWLHVAFALLTIGPLIVATMSTPRYVRARNVPVLRYLTRVTTVYSVISLGVLILGIVLAQMRNDFSHPWLSVSMTLFVVSLPLLVLVIRDQRRAIGTLGAAAKTEVAGGAEAGLPTGQAAGEPPGSGEAPGPGPAALRRDLGLAACLASVERGRIASMAGLASLIWLVILALMIWQP